MTESVTGGAESDADGLDLAEWGFYDPEEDDPEEDDPEEDDPDDPDDPDEHESPAPGQPGPPRWLQPAFWVLAACWLLLAGRVLVHVLGNLLGEVFGTGAVLCLVTGLVLFAVATPDGPPAPEPVNRVCQERSGDDNVCPGN